MAVINFNSAEVAPSTGVADALPAGWYNVMMDESDVKPTSKSTPENPAFMLSCRFNILDGQYAGRKLFVRLNIRNPNPQAVEIAYKDLSAICHAVGMVGMVPDSQMLHGKPLKVKVKVRPATAEYEASNDITAYKNINDNSVGNGAAAQMGMPPAQGVVPPAAQAWAPPQQQAPAGYAPQQGYQPPAQPAYAAPAPAAAPAWAPPAGGQPWQQPQQQPQQAPAGYGAPQGQPQQAPAGYAPVQQPMQQPQQAAPAGNPNPMAGQPPPWQQ